MQSDFYSSGRFIRYSNNTNLRTREREREREKRIYKLKERENTTVNYF